MSLIFLYFCQCVSPVKLFIQALEEKDDKEGFKSLIRDLFKIIGDKSLLCREIKWFFKDQFHNDYNSFGEIADIIQSPHEFWEFKYKNIAFLDAKSNYSSSKTPSIMHHLHNITGEDKREISDNDFENIKATHDLLKTKSAAVPAIIQTYGRTEFAVSN